MERENNNNTPDPNIDKISVKSQESQEPRPRHLDMDETGSISDISTNREFNTRPEKPLNFKYSSKDSIENVPVNIMAPETTYSQSQFSKEEIVSQSQYTNNSSNVRHLPIANVSRVMKTILNRETKISKESKEMVQNCVTDFISFITCEACEKCKNEKRKTINGDDLIYALEVFGFDKYVKILKIYLTKYRMVSLILI